MGKRILHDLNRCTGLGMCEAVAPDIFEIQPDGTMKVLAPYPPADRLDDVAEAVDGCPTEALSLVDE